MQDLSKGVSLRLQTQQASQVGELNLSCHLQFSKSEPKFFRAVHSTTRPFHCQSCGESFKLREKLTRHLRTHEGDDEKRNACCDCGKRFRTASNLKQHFLHCRQGLSHLLSYCWIYNRLRKRVQAVPWTECFGDLGSSGTVKLQIKILNYLGETNFKQSIAYSLVLAVDPPSRTRSRLRR